MRELLPDDIAPLTRILEATGAFRADEVACALELLHIVLNDPAQEDYEVLVATEGEQVAGYILFGPVPLTQGVYDIYWIATDPSLHGAGYGRKLIEATEALLVKRGGRMICLETSSQESYERTRRFYDRAGFIMESCIRDFYRVGDDRLTFVKRFIPSSEA